MKIKDIKRAISMTGLKLRKASPEILVVSGVIGAVIGTVMACKATLKLDTILDEASGNIERVKNAPTGTFPKDDNPSETVNYTEDNKKKDLVIVYAKTAVKVAKLYAPAAVIMTASVVGILTGHSILRKRHIALAAAYATVDKSFRKYRKGVIDNFGEEADKKLCGIHETEVTETVTDDKTGEPKEVKRAVTAVASDSMMPYARVFDDKCKEWRKTPEYNLMFLRSQQQYANDLLVANGYLFLNDVYEMLGFPKTKEGQVVGWIYNKRNPVGDNFVDFGIHEAHTIENEVDDTGIVYTLDFNVDGNILDCI